MRYTDIVLRRSADENNETIFNYFKAKIAIGRNIVLDFSIKFIGVC